MSTVLYQWVKAAERFPERHGYNYHVKIGYKNFASEGTYNATCIYDNGEWLTVSGHYVIEWLDTATPAIPGTNIYEAVPGELREMISEAFEAGKRRQLFEINDPGCWTPDDTKVEPAKDQYLNQLFTKPITKQ